MKVEVITPDKTLFTGEASLVQLPGKDGSFEILNNHAPLISILKKGTVRIVDNENQQHLFEISSGVLECNNNVLLILAE